MEVGGANGESYYMAGWAGGYIGVDYPTRRNQLSYSKGFYDVRKEYNLYNHQAVLSQPNFPVDGASIPSLLEQKYFTTNSENGDYDLINYTFAKDNNGGGDNSAILDGLTPEGFTSEGKSEKSIYWLVGPIKDTIPADQDWKAFGDGLNQMIPFFNDGEPNNLNIGYDCGLITASNGGTLTWDDDIDSIGTDFEIYGFNPQSKIRVGGAGLTLHYQLTNLPIVSQNGVVASTNKTIAIVNTLQESLEAKGDEDNNTNEGWYSHEPKERVFIDLNNIDTLTLNRLDFLITDDNNIEADSSLRYFTEATLIFRQKPYGQGYSQFAGQTQPSKAPLDPNYIYRR